MSEENVHLQLPIPEGRREEWAAALAKPSVETNRTRYHRLFLFRSGAEWFGLDAGILSMTMPYTKPRRLPHRKSGVIEGLISADGRVIVCLSLANFIGVLPSATPSAMRRMLVFSWKKEPFAIAADEVLGIEDVDMEQMASLPAGAGEALQKCVKGVVFHQGRAVIHLDAECFAEEFWGTLR